MQSQAQTNEPELLDVRQVAAMLSCSTRHVTRLEAAKQMPAAIKLGRLARWNRDAIRDWIAHGCPAVTLEVPPEREAK